MDSLLVGYSFILVLHSDKRGKQALGSGGSNLGNCCIHDIGYTGIEKSIAIEFDIFGDDPNDNHISIQTNGNSANSTNHQYSIACTTQIPLLCSNTRYYCLVSLDFKEREISIFLTDQYEKNRGIHFIQILKVTKRDLFDCLDDFFYIGFTGATGGLYCQQDLYDFGILR